MPHRYGDIDFKRTFDGLDNETKEFFRKQEERQNENDFKSLEVVYMGCVNEYMSFATKKIKEMKNSKESSESILRFIFKFMTKSSKIFTDIRVKDVETYGRQYVKELNDIKEKEKKKANFKYYILKKKSYKELFIFN